VVSIVAGLINTWIKARDDRHHRNREDECPESHFRPLLPA